MPRRAAAVRRETQPTRKYNNRLVTQLISKVLLDAGSLPQKVSFTMHSTSLQRRPARMP